MRNKANLQSCKFMLRKHPGNFLKDLITARSWTVSEELVANSGTVSSVACGYVTLYRVQITYVI
jgi:hypothetical protein